MKLAALSVSLGTLAVGIASAASGYDIKIHAATVVDGKYNVEEIHLGGTSTKLVFGSPAAPAGN
jgi:hypothetical protein